MRARELLCLLAIAPIGLVRAEADDKDKKTLGWFNATDLSLVVTDGNSKTETLGFKNTLRRVWKLTTFRLKLDVVRSYTADDRYLQVVAGEEWVPGETPEDFSTTVVDPPIEPDVGKYFAEATVSRKIAERFKWNTGASWDRNDDAGILSRVIAFGGLGHDWWDTDDLKFTTDYSLSYTDREEETPDPLKDTYFFGARLGFDYRNRFGKVTIYDLDFTSNFSLKDSADYNLDMTNAIAVNMGKRLALKVSLQWQFSNEPALEDVDVVARLVVVDPDGVPGNGDEFFRTVDTGGAELGLGESQTRKDELDTIFRTSLVIEF